MTKLLARSREGTARVKKIVEDLRTFSRVDHAELQDVDLHEGIERTLSLMEPRLKDGISVVKQYGDLPHIRCYAGQLNQVFMNLLMNACDAMPDGGKIAIRTLRTDRGDTLRAPFFGCSTGPLNQPRWPDIPGLETFKGPRLHSARWDATVPLAGRRVAVIGTGSTASQLIPPIAAQAGRLHVFQRTANWVLPRLDRRYNALDHLLAHLPPYAALVRWSCSTRTCSGSSMSRCRSMLRT